MFFISERLPPLPVALLVGPSRGLPLSCYNQKFPMADVHPLRALRYDLQRVSAAQVVTQPYDKITPAMQERYYAASPYNLVRIILGRHAADENAGDRKYNLKQHIRSLRSTR